MEITPINDRAADAEVGQGEAVAAADVVHLRNTGMTETMAECQPSKPI